MKGSWLVLLLILAACGCQGQHSPVAPGEQEQGDLISTSPARSADYGAYIPWGFYEFEIARDGSYGEVIPDRTASTFYGYHLNAVKLLETDPCTDCVQIDNIHLTAEGNLSVDVSITHPYDNPVYTGFDVRGIIMFPASQYVPCNDLREQAGFPPWGDNWHYRYSSSEKGDAELVNTEGWTKLWAPDEVFWDMWTESGFPIFEYYEGRFASGEELGTLNPFIRFHSNENRHMFEAGETVTRTYIIKPPATGPIEASYAIYAHWAEPDVIPVTDPATDFPLIANSLMPYELEIWQDGVLDPDAPPEVLGEQIHIHMKHWGIIPVDQVVWDWDLVTKDLIGSTADWAFKRHPSGNPDDYWPTGFWHQYYSYMPDPFPGTWPFIFRISQFDPDPWAFPLVGCEYYIIDIEFGALDGEW